MMGSVGFKEWAIVCEAMGRGEQSLILRKGGLAEGRAGFGFRHREFFLFPTLFHEQVEKTRLADASLPPAGNSIELKYFVRVEETELVTSLDVAKALAPLHVLREEVVRERFGWGGQEALHVAFVRVYRAEPSWIIPDDRRYGGCRSWVELPEPSPHELVTVLSEKEHQNRRSLFQHALASMRAI